MNELLRRFGFRHGIVFEGDAGGGGGTPPAPPAPADPPTPPAPSGGAPEKTFAQAEVDRIAAREKDEGRRAALASVTDALGCTPEEAKAILDAHRAAEDEQKTEAQRAREKADADAATAVEATAKATRAERDARLAMILLGSGVTIEVDEQGVPKGRAARILSLVTAGLPNDADSAKLVEAVEAVKVDMPELFGGPAPNGGGVKPPSGEPGTPPPPGAPAPAGGLARGAERAKALNEQSKKFDPTAVGL